MSGQNVTLCCLPRVMDSCHNQPLERNNPLTTRIIHGDCREVLPTLPAASVQCIVTSPPYYGLRDYGAAGQVGLEATPADYVEELAAVFTEAHRVLKQDGVLFLNLGDSYNNFRVQMGPGQALHGRAKLNGKPPEKSRGRGWAALKEKDLIGIPWRVAFALQDAGWYLRQDNIWSKPNPMPESVEDRTTRAHEYVFMLSKAPKYFYDAKAVQEPALEPNRVRADRFGGSSWKERGQHWLGGLSVQHSTRNRRTVWTIETQAYGGAHFATMPEELATICILAGSRPGDIVLDPFGGAGTTATVAARLGRGAILIELNPKYCQLAERRTVAETPPLPF